MGILRSQFWMRSDLEMGCEVEMTGLGWILLLLLQGREEGVEVAVRKDLVVGDAGTEVVDVDDCIDERFVVSLVVITCGSVVSRRKWRAPVHALRLCTKHAIPLLYSISFNNRFLLLVLRQSASVLSVGTCTSCSADVYGSASSSSSTTLSLLSHSVLSIHSSTSTSTSSSSASLPVSSSRPLSSEATYPSFAQS